MTTNKHIIGTLILTLTVLFIGCKKDFDAPPVSDLPVGNIITVDSLRNIYTAFSFTPRISCCPRYCSRPPA